MRWTGATYDDENTAEKALRAAAVDVDRGTFVSAPKTAPNGMLYLAHLKPVCKYLRMHKDTQPSEVGPESPYIELAVEVFSMLADATRIRLILALRDGEMSVNNLADIVDKQPTTVSQHLAKLRLARLVTPRRQGTTVFYSLTDEHPLQLVHAALLQAEHAVDADPRHHRPAGGESK